MDSRTVTGHHGRPMNLRVAIRSARKPAPLFRPFVLALALAGCVSDSPPAAAPFDPDSIPDAYRGSTAALVWPGATRAFQVRTDGGLYNGEWVVRFDLTGDGKPAAPPRVIAYEERWRPIVHWRRWSGRVRWDFEALALPGPGSRDSGLVVSLVIRATNTAPASVYVNLVVSLVPPDSLPPFVAADAPESPPRTFHWGPMFQGDTVHAFAAHAGSVRSGGLAWALAPGVSRSTRFVLPAHPSPSHDLSAWAKVPHGRRAAWVRRYWEETLRRGTRFELGDPEVERSLAAARVVMLASRERRGAHWVPIGSPLQYRDVWLRDGARVVAALAMSGHTREARELADGLALLEWPMGAYMSQRGQLDGTGQALWAFEQALLRPAPDDSVGRFAAAAWRAFRWCESQRDLGRQSGWPFGMMMPFGNPRDNELVCAQLVGNDAWALAGYRSAARLLRAAKRGAEADSVEAARARYLADFAAALRRTNAPDVPPSWQQVGLDWGNLAAAWPCGALAASDPRCTALARRVWAKAGGAGLCTYGETDSLHYYLGADLGTWALLAGLRAEADSVLDAMLYWRSASGGACEIMDRDGGYGRNLPPHGTSAAALVTLVRNALVFDDGHTLMLTLGARARWWRDGRVRRAPTRWGMIDVAFRDAGDRAEWNWTPVPVWTALTLPPGRWVAGALQPPIQRGPSPGVVLAPPGTRRARVALASREEARP